MVPKMRDGGNIGGDFLGQIASPVLGLQGWIFEDDARIDLVEVVYMSSTFPS